MYIMQIPNFGAPHFDSLAAKTKDGVKNRGVALKKRINCVSLST